MRVANIALAAALLAACGGSHKPTAEPELAGGESPTAFHRAIGLTLLRTDQPRRALPHLQRLMRLQPGRPEPMVLLARAYMGMEMYEQALTILERATRLAPTYAPAQALLGVLLDIRGEHEKAEAAHLRAIALRPNNAAYRNNLGFSRYLQGRYTGALEALRASLELDPSRRRVHNNLGFVYGQLGRVGEAREHFRIAGDPAEAQNNMGIVYEERGELERAYLAYAKALARRPDLAAARGNLERICHRLGKPVPQITQQRKSHEANAR